MKNAFAVLLCLFLLSVAACAPKVNEPADVQAIKDTTPAFDKAWNAGNAQAVAAIFTNDGMRMEPYQPALVGNDTIRASIQKYFDQFNEEGRNVAEDVRVSGDLAVARGTYEGKASLKAGGYSAQFKGKWMTAFQRQADGSWKAFWDIYNSDLPVADSLPMGVEEQALMKIEQEWGAAMAKNDSAAMEKMLASEYANNADGELWSKRQLIANMKSGAYKVASLEAAEIKVLAIGDTAIVHGLAMEKSTLNGKDTSGTYRFTDVFAKRDGQWLAVSTHATKVK